MTLLLDEYQEAAHRTALYFEGSEQFFTTGVLPREQRIEFLNLVYCSLKLNGESGEFAELVGKAIRDDGGTLSIGRMASMQKELGDVLWYVAEICTLMGWSLSEVAEKNIDKLAKRQREDALHGSGSDR